MFFIVDSIPNQYKTQEICEIVVSLYPFLIVYCPDNYITQKLCDEAVDDIALIPASSKIPQGAKGFNTLNVHTTSI